MTSSSPGLGEVRPLVREIPCTPDPLALYASLTDVGNQEGSFLLESADGGEGAGVRSILGLSCALRIACHGRTVTAEARSANGRIVLPWIAHQLSSISRVERRENRVDAIFPRQERAARMETAGTGASSPLDALRTAVTGVRCVDEPEEDTYLAAGIFSYDLIELFEDLPSGAAEPFPTPHFEFFVPDRLIIIDHRHRRTLVVAHAFGGAHGEANLHDASRAVGTLASSVESAAAAPSIGASAGGECLSGSPDTEEVSADLSDAEYANLVTRLRSHLEAGDVYQIVPSRTFSAPCPDPLSSYGRLREMDPSPYLFYVRARDHILFGASPETAVKVDDGPPRRVTVRPIAGTAGRGRLPGGALDADRDARNEAALHLDAKETAEHLMLVDLARNDVARVSRPGTREVTRLLQVEKYAHVMHLVSEVTGEVREDLDALDVFVAAMNPGTLIGAPKLRAARILREVESSRRGVYGGAVGYLTHRGRLDTAIAIRSATVREGVARVRAGAGVVLDSVPEMEARETRRKASAVLGALCGEGIRHG